MTNLAGGAHLGATFTLTAHVATRHYFASEHLRTAYVTSVRARQLEASLAGGPASTDPEHRSTITAGVMASVAFLEALINETYADASDQTHDSSRIAALSAATQTSMALYRLFPNEGVGDVAGRSGVVGASLPG